MAEVNTEEEERRAAAGNPQSRGVALADEPPDELPALLTIAVGVAILAIAIVWPSIRDTATSSTAAPVEAAAAEEVVEEDEPEETEEAVDEEPGVDLPAIEAGLGVAGLGLALDGNTVVVEGVVPDEDTRNGIISFIEGQPNVDGVDATGLVVEAPAVDAAVAVTAAQASIVLDGIVPDQATKDALLERAIAVYSEAQVEDRLEVNPAATPPSVVTLGGSMTDPVLYQQVLDAFAGIDGVELGQDQTLVLAESSEAEASLNSLEPIQFASGSSLIQPESEPILDEAAAILTANPDLVIEIGGHTDSTGDAAANESLSQDRADSVKAALEARGVTNEMTPVGFGERRLKAPDENDVEAQAMNRRIEFRILNG
ncbi:MAG: OmpA family protein [Actinomycetota bacterium]